jgi:hypothetical protein
MAESTLSSKAEAVCSPRGVGAAVVGAGADAVDAPLDCLADVETAADDFAAVGGLADIDAAADAATVEALPATAPLLAHPASAARTTMTAAGAS